MWSAVNAADPPLAAIFSVNGLVVSKEERALFEKAKPLGFILFTRNCAEPAQVRQLTAKLREILGRDCPILIDQEGGRVQRLKPPFWRDQPAMRRFGEMAEENFDEAIESLSFTILQQAEELRDCGINVNCAPVLDVLSEETHAAIGDRAFSGDPLIVARLGECVCRTFLEAGITPVIKHIPGHGRPALDSHYELPRVRAARAELDADLAPFAHVAGSNLGSFVWGMNAHVIFDAFDPKHPATVSRTVIEEAIRGAIGFGGFLLSDDLSMEALAPYGDISERALACLGAGIDAVLHCSGNFDEMEYLAETLPKLRPDSVSRLNLSAGSRQVAA